MAVPRAAPVFKKDALTPVVHGPGILREAGHMFDDLPDEQGVFRNEAAVGQPAFKIRVALFATSNGENSNTMCQPMVMMLVFPFHAPLTSTTGPGSK